MMKKKREQQKKDAKWEEKRGKKINIYK